MASNSRSQVPFFHQYAGPFGIPRRWGNGSNRTKEHKMRRTILVLAAAISLAMPLAASAQSAWDPAVFWHDAPASAWERVDFLQHRIDAGRADRSLNEREGVRAQADLRQIREVAAQMRERDGGSLNATDESYVQGRLDNLSRQIRWDRHD
jgi:opacity protein-like surface antigen